MKEAVRNAARSVGGQIGPILVIVIRSEIIISVGVPIVGGSQEGKPNAAKSKSKKAVVPDAVAGTT